MLFLFLFVSSVFGAGQEARQQNIGLVTPFWSTLASSPVGLRYYMLGNINGMPQRLMLDTGSSTLAVSTPNCTSCGKSCDFAPSFPSSQAISCQKGWCEGGCLPSANASQYPSYAGQCIATVDYGVKNEGGWMGAVYNTSFMLPGSTLAFPLAAAGVFSMFLEGSGSVWAPTLDGILGIRNTELNLAINQQWFPNLPQVLANGKYSMCFGSGTGGVIVWGNPMDTRSNSTPYDTWQLYNENILSNGSDFTVAGEWKARIVSVASMFPNGTGAFAARNIPSIAPINTILVDTGTPPLVLDSESGQAWTEEIQDINTLSTLPGCTAGQNGCKLQDVVLNQQQLSQWPTMLLTIEGFSATGQVQNRTYSFPPSLYFVPVGSESKYQYYVQANQANNQISIAILGATVLRGSAVGWDYTQNVQYFSQNNTGWCGSNTTSLATTTPNTCGVMPSSSTNLKVGLSLLLLLFI
jgi:hypothetical protein